MLISITLTQILEHGNPKLKTATFSNYDLRWEWYPKSNKQNEMLNAAFFYKKGKDLIEAFTLNDQNSQSGNQLMFKNSQEADFYGVELDDKEKTRISFHPAFCAGSPSS